MTLTSFVSELARKKIVIKKKKDSHKMNKSLFIFLSMCILSLFIITGCSREAKITKLTNIEKFEFYSKGRLDKVLVVGKPIKEKNRNDFEKYFSSKLKSRKTDAIPSYKVIPEMKDLNRDRIKEAAVKMEAGAVLGEIGGRHTCSVILESRA